MRGVHGELPVLAELVLLASPIDDAGLDEVLRSVVQKAGEPYWNGQTHSCEHYRVTSVVAGSVIVVMRSFMVPAHSPARRNLP